MIVILNGKFDGSKTYIENTIFRFTVGNLARLDNIWSVKDCSKPANVTLEYFLSY